MHTLEKPQERERGQKHSKKMTQMPSQPEKKRPARGKEKITNRRRRRITQLL